MGGKIGIIHPDLLLQVCLSLTTVMQVVVVLAIVIQLKILHFSSPLLSQYPPYLREIPRDQEADGS